MRTLQVMPAVLPGLRAMGLKAYSGGWPGGIQGVVLVFDTQSGALEAIVAAELVGRLRTAAMSAVATRYLARPETRVLGLVGAGRQARTQVDAIALVRPISVVRVYGRDERRRRDFAADVARAHGIEAIAVGSAEDAVHGADVVVTATPARTPVLRGEWLAPNAHVNAIGANWPEKRELDATAVRRADLVVVDALDQARLEAGDLIAAEREGAFSWERAIELQDVVLGRVERRTAEDRLTLFEAQGVALADVAVARLVVDAARGSGVGVELQL